MARGFVIKETGLPGLREIVRSRTGDERGFLSRMYCGRELAEADFLRPIVQINHTLTRSAGSVRGMHFQHPPHEEDKLISVLKGEIFDVAVDVRAGSPTFLSWHGVVLSADNACSLFIPAGFAHGFQTLQSDCELTYFHTAFYEPTSEGGLDPLDPALGIDWPLPVTGLSARDRSHPPLDEEFRGLIV